MKTLIGYMTFEELLKFFNTYNETDIAAQTKVEVGRLVGHGEDEDLIGVTKEYQEDSFYTVEKVDSNKGYKITLITYSDDATMFLQKSLDDGLLREFRYIFPRNIVKEDDWRLAKPGDIISLPKNTATTGSVNLYDTILNISTDFNITLTFKEENHSRSFISHKIGNFDIIYDTYIFFNDVIVVDIGMGSQNYAYVVVEYWLQESSKIAKELELNKKT